MALAFNPPKRNVKYSISIIFLFLSFFSSLSAMVFADQNGNDNYTTLLISSDNQNGDTVFTDTSAGGQMHTITPSGDVHHNTAQAVFNGSSIKFDGNGDMLTIEQGPDFNFGTDDFTIDCWVKSNSSTQGVILEMGGYTSGVMMQMWQGYIYIYVGGGYAGYSFAPSPNNWYHLAVVRQSGVIKFYINGVAQSRITGTEALAGSVTCNYDIRIGYGNIINYAIQYFNGYIQ